MESEEYTQGREAYERGEPVGYNPYRFGSAEWQGWARGWGAAKRAAAEDAEIAEAELPPVRTTDMMSLNTRAKLAHEANAKWWHDAQGNKLERNKGELICLMHSELSECMEGERKDLMDDKLPHRRMAEVELADVLIRIFDYAAAFGYDLDGAVREKMAFNAKRADHTHEARAAQGGKKW